MSRTPIAELRANKWELFARNWHLAGRGRVERGTIPCSLCCSLDKLGGEEAVGSPADRHLSHSSSTLSREPSSGSEFPLGPRSGFAARRV